MSGGEAVANHVGGQRAEGAEYYLGWDCANRTLAYSFLQVNRHNFEQAEIKLREAQRLIDEALKTPNNGTDHHEYVLRDAKTRGEALIAEAKHLIKNYIVLISGEVKDILGARVRDFSAMELARALYSYLEASEVSANRLAGLPVKVFVERQPPKLARFGGATTADATAVASQLMFYYGAHAGFECAYVDPKLKNKVCLAPHLRFETYLEGCNTEYRRKAARKKHAEDSFTYLFTVCHNANTRPIKKAELNHLADSCIQMIPHIIGSASRYGASLLAPHISYP